MPWKTRDPFHIFISGAPHLLRSSPYGVYFQSDERGERAVSEVKDTQSKTDYTRTNSALPYKLWRSSVHFRSIHSSFWIDFTSSVLLKSSVASGTPQRLWGLETGESQSMGPSGVWAGSYASKNLWSQAMGSTCIIVLLYPTSSHYLTSALSPSLSTTASSQS